MTPPIMRNPKVVIMLTVFFACLLILAVKGPSFGVDFAGGTLFQVHLADELADQKEKEQVRRIIQSRLDFSGLKDSSVQVVGSDLIFAQLAETDPRQIEKIESVLLKQGRFEAVIESDGEGDVIFTGEDFKAITKDPAKGYGVSGSGTGYKWVLPFTLSDGAARAFSEKTFHRCTRTGFDQQINKPAYECDKTYFFLDRPVDSVIVVPRGLYEENEEALLDGIPLHNIAEDTSLEEIIAVSNIPVFVADENGLGGGQAQELSSLSGEKRFAIIPSTAPDSLKSAVEEAGFTLNEVVPPSEIPWMWLVTGLREVISLSEDVTNLEPYVPSTSDPGFKVYASLLIRGFAPTKEQANEELKSLNILVESGSLPVSVDSISRVSVTPSLGKSFLFNVILIALIAAIVVAVILFIRYRFLALVAPMLFTMVAEATITLGIASLLSWPLDLAALAGLIAAIGYGVDDQIVITDELKKRKGSVVETVSLLNRAKRAFFIVVAAAATVVATMLPLLLLGPSYGMARLVGFAFTTIIGVLAGVLITRPAFQEIAKYVISKKETQE